MPKSRPSLTYTPLNIKHHHHHGPPNSDDEEDATVCFSSGINAGGRGGAITTSTTTGRKRKKGYSKSVSQKKELRRERRANKSRSKKDIIIGVGAGLDDFKENVGKNARRTSSDANASDWDEVISSPEDEFEGETTAEVDEVGLDDSQDVDVDFHVDESNDEDEDTTIGGGDEDDATNFDAGSPLVQKRLFHSTNSKKRRVIEEDEDESSQDLSVVDTKGTKGKGKGKDTSASMYKANAKKADKSGGLTKKDSGGKRGSSFGDNDSSDDEEEVNEIESKVPSPAYDGRRRSKRLEETQASSIMNNLACHGSDEDSENEFTVNSDASVSNVKCTSSGKEKSLIKVSNAEEKPEYSRANSKGKSKVVTCSIKKRSGYEDKNEPSNTIKDGQAANIDQNKKGTDELSFDTSARTASKVGNRVSKSKVAKQTTKVKAGDKKRLSIDCKDAAEANATKKNMGARAASSKSTVSREVNPFVKAARAKAAAAAAAASLSMEVQPAQRMSKNARLNKGAKKQCNEESPSSEEASEEASGSDAASEYQPTQGDGDEVAVLKRSPRPTRHASKATKVAPSVAPRRRKKHNQNKEVEGSIGEEAIKSVKLDNGSVSCLAKSKPSKRKSLASDVDSKSSDKKSKSGNKKEDEHSVATLDFGNDDMVRETIEYNLNTDGVDVEYQDDVEEDMHSFHPSMLLTQAAASQFMEQSYTSSTAELEGGNQKEDNSSDATYKTTGGSKKLKSIQLNTRSLISSAENEKNENGEARPTAKNGKLLKAHGETEYKLASCIELTTRGLSNMDPIAFLAAIQTQAHIESRSQHSSAVSPETNVTTELSGTEYAVNEDGESTNDLHLPKSSVSNNSVQMSSNELAQTMARCMILVTELKSLCEKVSAHFA